MNRQQRDYDVVVWGATGFTGSLVAEYLLAEYGVGRELRWAIAGRSEEKLEALRESLGAGAAALPVVTADSFDEPKLAAMVAGTRVVISTVGPYARYGSPLVAACVKHGTHYCDLAGEPHWIRQMIDEHHDAAVQGGVRIVHCCGFDSIPSDMGVWFLQREAKRLQGRYCGSIALLTKAMRGGPSGGTVASMTNLIKEARADRAVAKVLADPYGLNPPGEREGPDGPDQRGAVFDDVAGTWTAPFVMAAINTRVVRRSNALLGYPYGRDFRYREAMMTGRGAAGYLKAGTVTAGLGGFLFAASFDTSRGLLQRFVLPKPGEGPDRDARESGFFDLRLYGKLDGGIVFRAKVTGDRDPGYGSTSKMLAESAVCLAKNELPSAGGVLTPASAMGEALFERLRTKAGLGFEMLDDA